MDQDHILRLFPFSYVNAWQDDHGVLRANYVEWEQDFGIFAKGQHFDAVFVNLETKTVSAEGGWEQHFGCIPAHGAAVQAA